MKAALRAGLVAAALVLTIAATGAGDKNTIVQFGRAFHPGELTVVRGQTVTFSNRDDFIHQIYVKSDTLNFDSDEQPPGQNVPVMFPVPGTFEVRCHIHPKMSLTVHVR